MTSQLNFSDEILDFLNVQPAPPTSDLLERLLRAYARTIPWESASRIVKRAQTTATEECPRWPSEFWKSAMTAGTGGTCFESNYAFFALLCELGYEGYLTINNMGDTIGCHTAIVLRIDGEHWLTDVGYPIDTPLRLDESMPSQGRSSLMDYTLRPDGSHRYQVERQPHPQTNIFTLIDQPVPDDAYRNATVADYGTNGLFLDRIVINKVIDEKMWRFNSAVRPFQLECFSNGERTDYAIEGHPAEILAEHFAIDLAVLDAAFTTLRL